MQSAKSGKAYSKKSAMSEAPSNASAYTTETTKQRLEELKRELENERTKRAQVEGEIQQLRKTFDKLA